MKCLDALTMSLVEGWLDSGLAFHVQARLALHDPAGPHRSPIRLIQIEDGEELAAEGARWDTMLLVLDGAVDVLTAQDHDRCERGSVALIPPFVPYTVRNVETGAAHLLCLFPKVAVDSVFVTPLKPLSIQVRGQAGTLQRRFAS